MKQDTNKKNPKTESKAGGKKKGSAENKKRRGSRKEKKTPTNRWRMMGKIEEDENKRKNRRCKREN